MRKPCTKPPLFQQNLSDRFSTANEISLHGMFDTSQMESELTSKLKENEARDSNTLNLNNNSQNQTNNLKNTPKMAHICLFENNRIVFLL